MKQFLLAPILCCLGLTVLSQNENDLFRASKTSFQGTARFEAMAGSFGALGADLSSGQVNPAGFGRYSSSQAGISFYGGSNANTTTFQGVETKTNNGLGGVSNLAVVLTDDVSENSTGWLFTQLGFGFNRIENFRNTFRYEGQQFQSLLDVFAGQATGYYPEELNTFFPFSTSLAWETYAINFDGPTTSYYSLLNAGDMYHKRTFESKGGINEFFFSYSANYLNKLYLGGSIGIRSYRYDEQYVHSETLMDTSGTDLRSFDYSYDLNTKGSGTNIKIGAIYLFSEAFRVGLALHTPTFFELTDNWSANMTAYFQDSTNYLPTSLVPTGDYKYRLRNPGKLIGSLAYVFGTMGCVNLDVEYLDYRHAHFMSTKDENYAFYDYKTENSYADEVFKNTFNLRLGGEIVVATNYFLRGGFAYYGNAFRQDSIAAKQGDLFISGGVGVRFKRANFDLAYKQRMITRSYYAFSESSASIKGQTGIFTLSCALHF